MASLLSHPAAALALGAAFQREGDGRRFWIAGALCTMIPDLDVAAFSFGIPYEAPLGHRGLTHSLLFAALLALALARWAFEEDRLRVGLYLFLATASHGLLDAMTTGGEGVGFLLPFVDHRYFLPFRPIRVSPIGAGAFLSARGLRVLQSELVWVWTPCLA
ncbi:MAG TPA: metal-dependent hydrolase, partial [Holophagaceae bacterium]|nr:metal-dependent hydrolase [Holophagaceae bacterium]